MLAYVRDTVQVKCAGLSDEQARRAPLPGSPLTNISSLVSHLRWVEYYWIRVILLGEPDHAPITDEDPDAEMRLGLSVPLSSLETGAQDDGRPGSGAPGHNRSTKDASCCTSGSLTGPGLFRRAKVSVPNIFPRRIRLGLNALPAPNSGSMLGVLANGI